MTFMSDPYQDLIDAIRLSQDLLQHTNGELALRSLRQHQHYPLLLIRAAADQSIDLCYRQMVYILLKQLVRQHWDSDEIPTECKAEIRKLVLNQIVVLVNCKPLLTQCCLLIGSIAEYDLQTHEWPDLLPVLIRYASTPSVAAAAIYCISLLTSDLPQEHLLEISKHLYPVLTEIFGNSSNPALLRYQSVCVFTALVDSIAYSEDEQESLRDILSRYLSSWFQMVQSLFSSPIDIGSLGFGLYIEACDLIAILSRAVPYKNRDVLLQSLPGVIECVLRFAIPLLPLYQKQCIDGQIDDDACSSNSFQGVERSSLSHLFTSVADLFSVMSWPVSDSVSEFLAIHLDEIVQLAVVSLQVPFGEEPMFEEDVDYLTSYSARSASKDLISRLQNFLVFGNTSQHSSLEQYCRTCLSEKSHWKVVEAGLIILGQLSPIPEDLFPIVAEFALNSISHIRIRALWVMKQILTSSEYTDLLFSGIVNAVIASLSHESEPVRLTATDCISVMPPERLICVGDALSYIMQQICNSVRVATSQDHISTFLSTMRTLLSISQLRQAHLHMVCNALMEIWSQHVHDAVVISRLTDTLAVCCVPDTIQTLQLSLVPSVINILKQCDSAAYEGLIDLLSKLVSPCDQVLLADELSDLVTPLVVQILSNSDDLAIVTSCISCLTNITRNATDTVGSSLTMIMPAVYYLLQNRTMIVPVGNLIYSVISAHHGRFQEHDVRTLLHLLQDRILAAGTSFAAVGDSVLAFSKLVHAFNASNIVLLLCNLNETSPGTLNQLFKKWVELYEDVQSPYLKNVTLLALSEIARVRRPEIDAVIVPGYQIVDTNAPRRTRSQGPATAVIHKQISLTSKIISLLLAQLISSNAPSEQFSDSQDSQTGRGAPLDQFVSDFLEEYVDDTEKSSGQLLFAHDPIANTDLPSFVPNFIRELSSSQPEVAKWCFDQLTVNDQLIVQNCLNRVS